MNTSRQKTTLRRPLRKRVWIPVTAGVLTLAVVAVYFLWPKPSTVAAQEETYNTALVRTGSISLSTSGSGTLTAAQEKELAFSVSGTVAGVNVQVGDNVGAGDELARLADTSELEANLSSAKLDLATAQQELATLKQNASANLASARLGLADAREALDEAKSAVVQEGWVRCDQDTIDAYYYKYTRARDALEALGDGGGSQDYYLTTIVPARNVAASAYAAYLYCTGYTEYEIASSNAELALAEAELASAGAALQALEANNGLDPVELATAENKVDNAEYALEQAQEKLDGAVLIAPFDGTILSVAGEAGDEAGTGAFIIIADLAHPQVEFSVDETDFSAVFAGEQATVVFDSYPDLVFSGTVLRVNPALETIDGYSVVSGVIQLELDETTDSVTLAKGLNGTVTLVQATAQNVLLVPVQAVRDLGDGTYSVFVLDESGKPKLRVVEVGLMDLASAEIKSGLSAGDVVTSGLLDAASVASSN